MRSAYVPTGVRRAEWLHSASRNRRDPSRHRCSPGGVVALCHSVIAGKGEAYKQLDCEVAERERKSEQVIVVMNGGTTEPAGAKGL